MYSVKFQSLIAAMFVAVSMIIAPISNSLIGAQPAMQGMQNNVQASPATLYIHPNCPHCDKVTDYLKQINKTIAFKDISNPMYKKELQSYGQQSVPVMVVGSQAIVGADQILNYLKQHPEVLR